jgi:hypothetical protein
LDRDRRNEAADEPYDEGALAAIEGFLALEESEEVRADDPDLFMGQDDKSRVMDEEERRIEDRRRRRESIKRKYRSDETEPPCTSTSTSASASASAASGRAPPMLDASSAAAAAAVTTIPSSFPSSSSSASSSSSSTSSTSTSSSSEAPQLLGGAAASAVADTEAAQAEQGAVQPHSDVGGAVVEALRGATRAPALGFDMFSGSPVAPAATTDALAAQAQGTQGGQAQPQAQVLARAETDQDDGAHLQSNWDDAEGYYKVCVCVYVRIKHPWAVGWLACLFYFISFRFISFSLASSVPHLCA